MAGEGKKATFRVLTRSELMGYLEKKLDEEVAEFHESKDVEELADILEVVFALANAKGINDDRLTVERLSKRAKRGGFSNRILLLDVEEE